MTKALIAEHGIAVARLQAFVARNSLRSAENDNEEGYVWWIATGKEDLTPAEMKLRAEEFFKRAQQPA